MYKLGIDVGSTTMKVALLSENGDILYTDYQRHYSEVISKALEMLRDVKKIVKDEECLVSVSGSAGMGIAEALSIPFVQEVYATRIASKKYAPSTDCIIELGGEDAKILFLTNGMEVRMNGTCAGGTGAFIDQMATLLGVEKEEIDKLAKEAKEIYTIASRCGVFAKSDIQPLINQGARKEDIAASILVSVVNQTIAGLSQGRKIVGNVLYLGGPLTFISSLRYYFDKALNTKGILPPNSLYFVALGSALNREGKAVTLSALKEKLSSYKAKEGYVSLPPLFESEEEYQRFKTRHEEARLKERDISSYSGPCYIGLDSGSTTIKCCLISQDGELLSSFYSSNNGNPIETIRNYLLDIYSKYPSLNIRGAATTGYGEDLLKEALRIDYSLVETQAHFIGAKSFLPSVDFIIDIGGQDIKCFKIVDGAIDDIFLNEACSSGCGSFLQTFAASLGKSVSEFSSYALLAQHPVDLGSRCTVFMNSQVKQAQKDGATVGDISSGLAISVVKNALYKVIRTSSAKSLGKNIVVQGGTFLNDAVLRAFEKELGVNVIRPTIAGLMGAYGAALYAKKRANSENRKKSTVLGKKELESFIYKTKSLRCGGCTNNCLLTVNTFDENRRYISGNKCTKPLGKKKCDESQYNIYAYKQSLLMEYIDKREEGDRGTIGLPLSLGMYELLPFYHTLFTKLHFTVVTSPFSDRDLYVSGQDSIASDTVCFPAKLMHGHIEYLKNEKVDKIFIPCSSYNIDEERGTNHFNCPVVAYYGEVIRANEDTGSSSLILGYLSLENKKHFASRISKLFNLDKKEVYRATLAAFEELEKYKEKVRVKGDEIIKRSREEKRHIIVLCGRPYHVDKEVNHSIDTLITSLGASVISEDSLYYPEEKQSVNVLNQWTYHARLYGASKYVGSFSDMDVVQLVSFGCGLDAVTTDEVREILRRNDKIYTQLKIDEITNVGAVRIRLRSLFAALEEKTK